MNGNVWIPCIKCYEETQDNFYHKKPGLEALEGYFEVV